MSEELELKKSKKKPIKPLSDDWKINLKCVVMVTISTVIYCMGVMWFLEPACLYSGGVTGVAQLLSNFSLMLTGKPLNLGLIILLINVPVLIFGWKKVSKRFVICSVISIAIQTLLMNEFFPKSNIGKNSFINNV